MKTSPLLLALLLIIVHVAPRAGAQGTTTPAEAWGEVAGGLQLQVGTGKNAELLTETRLMLFLNVGIRNVSGAAVSVNLDQATYDFEYEIDGTWYAFEPKAPVRTPLTALRADAEFRNLTRAIAPGSTRPTGLTVPCGSWPPWSRFAVATTNHACCASLACAEPHRYWCYGCDPHPAGPTSSTARVSRNSAARRRWKAAGSTPLLSC